MPRKPKVEDPREEEIEEGGEDDGEGRRTKVVDFEMHCPHCEGLCSVAVFRRTITPAEPAITELIPIIRKGGQASLDLGVPNETGPEVEAGKVGGGRKRKQ